ncbi:MAG: copper resistance protein CopC [Mycobacterium sp.]
MVAVLGTIGAGSVWTAAPAAAHATVVSSAPVDGSHVDASPAVLSFDLNEPVSLVDGSAQLIDASGARHPFAAEHLESGARRIVLDLPQQLPDGAYLATARVISADTHVVSLSIRFTVGTVTGQGQWAGIGAGQPVIDRTVLLPVKAAVYLGLIVSVGLFLASRWARPDALGTRRFLLIYRCGAGLLTVGLLGRLAVLVTEQAGGLTAASWSTAATVAGTPFGTALVIATVLGALSVGYPPGPARAAQGLGFLYAATAVTAVTLGGHGAATEFWPLPFVATFVHVYAVVVWLGGVVVIGALGTSVPQLRRWHRVAVGHVVLAVVAGVTLALLQVHPLAALVTTSYGITLLVKVSLVAAAVGVGYLMYRRQRGHVRTVLVELGLALLVIAVTSSLSSLTPAKDSYTTTVATRLDFGGAGVLSVDIDTVRRGAQVVTIDAARGAEVGVELSSAQANVARLPVAMTANPGGGGTVEWRSTGLIVPASGRWKVTVRFDDGQGPRLASFYYQVL